MAQINKIAVIGAGTMGSGIAQKIAQEGINVVIVDTKEEFVERGISNIRQTLKQAVDRKILTQEQVHDILSRVIGTCDYEMVADADLVIEAVFEDKQIKLNLFDKLDKICEPKTILATNTSSYYVSEFAEKISRPDRFIGMHYFYHPAKNRLLEIIPHDGTSAETLEKTVLAAKLHAKTAIVVKDAPGFAVNRFFVPFCNESVRMLEDGLANIPTIEAGAKKAFGIGMGPFELMNVSGIPIAVHASTTLGNELGPFYATPALLKTQMDSGEYWDLSGDVDESKIQAVIDWYYGALLGVTATLVQEGIASMEDTDRGAKVGLRWSRGPFEIMNEIGIEKTCQLVEANCKKYSDFKMPEILIKQREIGKPFAFNYVDLETKGNIAFITINRPEAMNALNETVVAQLAKRFEEAEKSPDVKAIVFQGAGKAFVAGADIKWFVDKIKADKIDDIYKFTRMGHEMLLKVENSDKLTIALLDGLSLGGGSELALACQAIVATPAGSMGFPETNIGIFPGQGGMLRMARHVGPELAKYYVFTGSPLNAEDLHSLGIFTRLVKPAEVDSTINQLISKGKPDKYRQRELPDKFKPLAKMCSPDNVARLLAGESPEGVPEALAVKTAKIISFKAPLALKMANEIINAQAGKSIPEAVEVELGRLHESFSAADALEGLSSFSQKRKPTYQGK